MRTQQSKAKQKASLGTKILCFLQVQPDLALLTTNKVQGDNRNNPVPEAVRGGRKTNTNTTRTHWQVKFKIPAITTQALAPRSRKEKIVNADECNHGGDGGLVVV